MFCHGYGKILRHTGQNPITKGDLEWILTKLLFTVTILSFDIPSPNVYNMTVNKINLHFAGNSVLIITESWQKVRNNYNISNTKAGEQNG